MASSAPTLASRILSTRNCKREKVERIRVNSKQVGTSFEGECVYLPGIRHDLRRVLLSALKLVHNYKEIETLGYFHSFDKLNYADTKVFVRKQVVPLK